MVIFCTNCCTCCSGAWIEALQGSVKCDMQRHNLLAMLTFGHAYAENTLAYLQEGALASYFPNATFPKIDSCRSVYRINTSTQAASSTQWDILRFRPLYYGSPDWRAAAPLCTTIIDFADLIKSKNFALLFSIWKPNFGKKIAFFLFECLWCRFLITWSRVQTIKRPIQIQCILTGSEVTKMTLWTKRTLNNHDQFLFFILLAQCWEEIQGAFHFWGRNVSMFFFFLLICLWQSAGVQQALSRLR